jgi:hypothetical protein
MQEITLNFTTEDPGLNLTGVVHFPDRVDLHGVNALSVRGLADWRHAPANIIHVNESLIQSFNMPEQSKKFSKVGLNWIGIKAHSNILISHAIRAGRNGTKNVQMQLTKFFKVLGASSVKFSVVELDRALSDQNREASGSGSDNNDDNDNT